MATQEHDFRLGTAAIEQAIAEGLPDCDQSVYRPFGRSVPGSIEVHVQWNGHRLIATFTRDEVLEAGTCADAVYRRVQVITERMADSCSSSG